MRSAGLGGCFPLFVTSMLLYFAFHPFSPLLYPSLYFFDKG